MQQISQIPTFVLSFKVFTLFILYMIAWKGIDKMK